MCDSYNGLTLNNLVFQIRILFINQKAGRKRVDVLNAYPLSKPLVKNGT